MEDINLQMLLFLFVAGFVASFVDSVVGGGGLIMIPALMLTGLEPVVVLGTNKFAAFMGAFTSAVSFFRSGKADFRLLKKLFFLSFFGSLVGVYAVYNMSSEFLRPLVVVMLILVTVYSLFKKNFGINSSYKEISSKHLFLAAGVALVMGFYDGFFGPGTGSFLMFFFVHLGFDFVGAAANARVLNFASNVAAAMFFAYLGTVNYSYALPVAIAMILGAIVGTKVALSKGAAYVKPLFVVITVLLIGKQLFELLK